VSLVGYCAKKAWRILPGESPGRARASHPPVSSVAAAAESAVLCWRTKQLKRTQSILQAAGVTAYPESWYSFEISLLRMARDLTFTEANMKHPLG